MSFEMEKSAKKPKVSIIPASINHAPYIFNITREAFKQYIEEAKIPGSIDALTESLEDIVKDINEKVVFIAEVDGVPSGSIRITVKSDNTAYISRFGTLYKYQSMGIGRALMEEAIRFVMQNGIQSISLHTAANSNLVGFYNQFGFTITEITYDRGYPRALMKREH